MLEKHFKSQDLLEEKNVVKREKCNYTQCHLCAV